MAWKAGTIKLAAAQTIFEGIDIQPIKIGDKVAGYKATGSSGHEIQDTGLTELCRRVWKNREKF